LKEAPGNGNSGTGTVLGLLLGLPFGSTVSVAIGTSGIV